MKFKNIFQDKLLRRLTKLYILLGLIPAVLLSIFSAGYLLQQNRNLTAELNDQLNIKSEAELENIISLFAGQYDAQFREKNREVSQTAIYLSEALLRTKGSTNDSFSFDTVQHDEGWKTNAKNSEIGFSISPLADINPSLIARQNAIFASLPAIKSMHASDATIRSTFIVSADQAGWIYPNRFWTEEIYVPPSNPDFTSKHYYHNSEGTTWYNPYLDIDPEITVVTVTAPIMVNGNFCGNVGIDFSISTILNEIVETAIGDEGFLFLLGQDEEIILLPEKAAGWLVPEGSSTDPEDYIESKISSFVPAGIRNAFDLAGIPDMLQSDQTKSAKVELIGGSAYLAVSPLEEVPWFIAVVLPVSETTELIDSVGILIHQNTSIVFLILLATVAGFIVLILVGGVFNLQRLAIPIQNLAEAASEISSGNLRHRIPESAGDDELTSLVNNFNQMASSIQTMQENIEDQRVQLENTLVNLSAEYEAFIQVALLINKQEKLQVLLVDALKAIQPIAKAEISTVILIEDEEYPSSTAAAFLPGFDLPASRAGFNEVCLNHPKLKTVIDSQKEILLKEGDPEFDFYTAPFKECLQSSKLKNIYFLPISFNGKISALLTLMWTNPAEISEQTVSFLQAISRLIGLLIEHFQFLLQTHDIVIMKERQKFARDLHDSAVQSLFTLGLTIQGLNAENAAFAPKEKEKIEFLNQQINQIRKEMRSLINELRPINIAQGQFENAIHNHANSLNRIWDIETTISITGDINQISLKSQQNLNRVIQEALNNIGKHSSARKVSLDLNTDNEYVSLEIKDDGVGFNLQRTSHSETPNLGLLSMRERVEMMGGVLQIRTSPEQGTSISVRIPLTGELQNVE